MLVRPEPFRMLIVAPDQPCPELGISDLRELLWSAPNRPEIQQLSCKSATRNEGVGSSSLPVGSKAKPTNTRLHRRSYDGALRSMTEQDPRWARPSNEMTEIAARELIAPVQARLSQRFYSGEPYRSFYGSAMIVRMADSVDAMRRSLTRLALPQIRARIAATSSASTSSARAFSRTCSTLVAPNRTLVTPRP